MQERDQLTVPTRRVSGRTPPTAVSLMANTSMYVNCVNCNGKRQGARPVASSTSTLVTPKVTY